MCDAGISRLTSGRFFFLSLNQSKNTMTKKFNYNQRMDIKYGHQELIDVNEIVKECTDTWFNQTLTKVNGSVVRIGIVEGEYHWHKHDEDDEFFFVLSGKLFIDLEDKTVELNPNEGMTVSKGVMHKTRAPQKTVMLMVETDTIDPIGKLE
jgi:mannose-6-phosphate isomerase-like protein (cupin superfamily)